jgi:hypothetical protein
MVISIRTIIPKIGTRKLYDSCQIILRLKVLEVISYIVNLKANRVAYS